MSRLKILTVCLLNKIKKNKINKRLIHAHAHETLQLNFSKAFRLKIKQILYSDREIISLKIFI